MGKNLQKQFSFRTDDTIIEKINFIADYNTRTRNKEIEHLLKKHISDFESQNGEIIKNNDGIMVLARPTQTTGKSSTSKIG